LFNLSMSVIFRAFPMNDWMKQRDLLVEEAMAFAQAAADRAPKMALMPVPQPNAAQDVASSAQRPLALAELAPTDTPEGERIVIQRRLANFKAHQERFEREREDYFQETLGKARANQWTPQSQPTKSGQRSNR
jgi:hypothetical protein